MTMETSHSGARIKRQRSLGMILTEVFGPLGQMFLYLIGSAAILSVIVVFLAFLLQGTRDDLNLMEATLIILPQVIVDGMVRGFLYASIALGYTMVYGVLEIINFAHGEIFMVGAFTGAGFAAVLDFYGILEGFNPFLFIVLAVLLGMIVSGMVAMLTERVAYRQLRNSPRLVALISAIGMSLFLQDLARMISTSTGLGFNVSFQIPELGEALRLATIPISPERDATIIIDSRSLIFIVAAILMLIGLNYLVNV
ncbi:MAG: branched-chain amino acid ABC transporter permease, partial [Chloroflexaceae bacterium]|nr:branched-chain amino acid ABC transporter permease [Chloroflexaceae bacterium]